MNKGAKLPPEFCHTARQPATQTRIQHGPKRRKIEREDAFYPDPSWLGLVEFFPRGCPNGGRAIPCHLFGGIQVERTERGHRPYRWRTRRNPHSGSSRRAC